MRTLVPSRLMPILALFLAGCASGTSMRSRSSALLDSRRVFGEELTATLQPDLYEAIATCRPALLQTRDARGRVPALYVDGIRMPQFDFLRDIPLTEVSAVEFMSAPDATTRYGIGHDVGALLVWTKRGRAVGRSGS